MSDSPFLPSGPERLLAHEDWLRQLSRRLVDDEDAAEDVVQETWRRALESSPRQETALRSWLGSVARHFAFDLNRRRRRRSRREEAVAKPEALSSTAELVLRLSRQREVLETVLSLEEPFREAILLRFYEELPPRRIAQRLSIPVTTVKSRLRRGLERLRAQLAKRYGEEGWRPALLPLVLLPSAAMGGAIAPVLGGLLGVVALVAGARTLVDNLGEVPAPATPALSARIAPAEDPSSGLAAEAPSRARREPAEGPELLAAEAGAASKRIPDARPVEGEIPAEFFWIDLETHSLRGPSEQVCDRREELLAAPDALRAALEEGRGGVWFLPRESAALAAVRPGLEALSVRVHDARGELAADLPVQIVWEGREGRHVLWRGRSVAGLVRADGLARSLGHAFPHGEILATFDFPLADERASSIHGRGRDLPCLQAPPTGAIEVALHDASGAPLAPGACVLLRSPRPDGSAWTQALAVHEGSVRFAPVAVGALLQLEVRSPEGEVERHPLPGVRAEGETVRSEIATGRPESQVAGTLLDPEGRVQAGLRCAAELRDGKGRLLGLIELVTDAAGRFVAPLGALRSSEVGTELRLRVEAPWGSFEVPFAPPEPGARCELGALVAVRQSLEILGRVVDAEGRGLGSAHVRVERALDLGDDLSTRLWIEESLVLTGSRGEFAVALGGSSDAPRRLVAECEGRYGQPVPWTPWSGELELTLFPGGSLEGRCLLARPDDWRELAVVTSGAGLSNRLARLDPTGRWELRGLPPGPIHVEVRAAFGEGMLLARSEILCAASDSQLVLPDFDLRSTHLRIERRLIGTNGPLADQPLEIWRAGPRAERLVRARTDSEGRVVVWVPLSEPRLELRLQGAPPRALADDAQGRLDAVGWIAYDLPAPVVEDTHASKELPRPGAEGR